MLSRSAERLYWLARYLERTENMARLINVTMHLIYDLPSGIELGWGNLLNISGVETQFYQRFRNATEHNTTRFLLTDLSNPGSLLMSLNSARENIRTSRELMPDEAWEQVNEMYLYAKANIDNVSNRRGRAQFLQDIMRGCQRFTGFIAGSMSHNDSYRFICLGRNLERADMTTRMMDFGTVLLAESRSLKMREYESILWINVLKSLSAVLMYRKQVRHRIKGGDVLNFLLKDPHFPGAIDYCLQQIARHVKVLPNSVQMTHNLSELEQQLIAIDIRQAAPSELHQILDGIQVSLNVLHQQISETWFLKFDDA